MKHCSECAYEDKMDVNLSWIVYPPDFDLPNNCNDMAFPTFDEAMVSMALLGKGAKLFVDPMVITEDDIYWPGLKHIVTNEG